MSQNKFFNAHHSPIGAFSSFTLGFKGASGGFDLEMAKPPRQNIFIGLERTDGKGYDTLPFHEIGGDDESKRYDIENPDPNPDKENILFPFQEREISGDFQVATDSWSAGDLTFRILSPVRSVPDPETASVEEMKEVLLPAVLVELEVDNTASETSRRAFFGFQGTDVYSGMRRLDDVSSEITGVGQGRFIAIAAEKGTAKSALHFTMEDILTEELQENWTFGLGRVGALIMDVPAGVKETYRFAICFHRSGYVTSGIDASYYYNHYFSNLEAVAEYALAKFDVLKHEAEKANERFAHADLSADQTFMLAHANVVIMVLRNCWIIRISRFGSSMKANTG